MKLTIGEMWRKEFGEGYKVLTVKGLDAISSELVDGEVVVPKDGDSLVEVDIIYPNFFNEMESEYLKLRDIVENWERGPTDDD